MFAGVTEATVFDRDISETAMLDSLCSQFDRVIAHTGAPMSTRMAMMAIAAAMMVTSRSSNIGHLLEWAARRQGGQNAGPIRCVEGRAQRIGIVWIDRMEPGQLAFGLEHVTARCGAVTSVDHNAVAVMGDDAGAGHAGTASASAIAFRQE